MSALKYFLNGRAAAAAAASVSAAASSSNAQARAPVQAAPHQQAEKRLDDEWLLTYHGNQGDVILFKPFQACEIDDAFADVAKVVRSKRTPVRDPLLPPSAVEPQDEGRSGTSTPTSDGNSATSEIMRTCLTGSGMYSSGWVDDPLRSEPSMDMMTLLELTNKMLKRPGMQVEIVKAMIEDAEVRNILLREGHDVDGYLFAAGAVPMAGLLPPSVTPSEGQVGEQDHGNVLSDLVHAMLSALGQTGSGVGRLLGWLRMRFSLLLPRQAAAFEEGQAEEAAGGAAPQQQRGLPVFWQRVLTVATVVAVIVIFRRPVASFVRMGVARAGAAGAAAGAAAWAGAAAAGAAGEKKPSVPDAAADEACTADA